MADPNPNKALIEGIAACHTAHQVKAALATHGISEFINLFQALNGISDQMDKACIIDFCLRHGDKQLTSHTRTVTCAHARIAERRTQNAHAHTTLHNHTTMHTHNTSVTHS